MHASAAKRVLEGLKLDQMLAAGEQMLLPAVA